VAEESRPGPSIPGLTNPRSLGLQRFPIRTRESGATLSAWRLAVACEEGEGVLVCIDSVDETLYRGEGVFLGWDQERLAAAYRALQFPSDEAPFEISQLG
jgi:hypothetical protein